MIKSFYENFKSKEKNIFIFIIIEMPHPDRKN